MAVAEYMLVMNSNGRMEIPGFIGDRGHWYNPADNTYIGWIDDTREFYVPDTIVTLTKEELVQRQLTMHATTPMIKPDGEPGADPVQMTDEEVRASVEAWYDSFVEKNS